MNQAQVSTVRTMATRTAEVKRQVERLQSDTLMRGEREPNGATFDQLADILRNLFDLATNLERVADLLEEEFPPTLKDRCEQFVAGTLDFGDFEAMLYDLSRQDGIVDKEAEWLLEVVVGMWAKELTHNTIRAVVKAIAQEWWNQDS